MPSTDLNKFFKNTEMKLLKNILWVYVVIFGMALVACFLMAPIIISHIMQSEKWCFLYFIIIPVLIGLIKTYAPHQSRRPSKRD